MRCAWGKHRPRDASSRLTGTAGAGPAAARAGGTPQPATSCHAHHRVVDGLGIPLALGDPGLTVAAATQDVLAALLQPGGIRP